MFFLTLKKMISFVYQDTILVPNCNCYFNFPFSAFLLLNNTYVKEFTK